MLKRGRSALKVKQKVSMRHHNLSHPAAIFSTQASPCSEPLTTKVSHKAKIVDPVSLVVLVLGQDNLIQQI